MVLGRALVRGYIREQAMVMVHTHSGMARGLARLMVYYRRVPTVLLGHTQNFPDESVTPMSTVSQSGDHDHPAKWAPLTVFAHMVLKTQSHGHPVESVALMMLVPVLELQSTHWHGA